ncbi:urokinase plasminogen activator surface receptor-like [Elgaria multicarinata webbii]|uniref:urokinase plasminogen activator surface receptor-like n=1 Tax=Elgaria multicarinata webbii TaxID=159646 RepID=UPI002FCD0320
MEDQDFLLGYACWKSMKAIMKAKVSAATLIFCLGMANSLTCWKCLSREGNCMETNTEVCSLSQDSCILEIKQFFALSAVTVKQGCGTSNQCRRYLEGHAGLLYRGMYCCSSNLCRPLNFNVSRDGSRNGVKCQSCIGSTAECGQDVPSQPCYGSMDRCVQISQRFLPGEELEPIIKGCGNSSFKDAVVAYQIGKDFAYIDQKVCRQSNCNNRNVTDISSRQPNGLRCYTCRGSEDGECARDRLQLLNCTGAMDQCVHVIKKSKGLPVTIQKGCATKTMCDSNQGIYFNLMRQDYYAKCCKTPLCNRAESPSAPVMLTMGTALASWLALIAWK